MQATVALSIFFLFHMEACANSCLGLKIALDFSPFVSIILWNDCISGEDLDD